jgi:hypothetical protein
VKDRDIYRTETVAEQEEHQRKMRMTFSEAMGKDIMLLVSQALAEAAKETNVAIQAEQIAVANATLRFANRLRKGDLS